jgi:RimJ/RimL family protein N-acetyltransferase
VAALALRRALGAPRFPIRTRRLELRPFAPGDAVAMHRVYADAEVMRYVGRGAVRDMAGTAAMLEAYAEHQRRHGFSCWAVLERGGDEPIGDAGLFLAGGIGPEVELGYTLGLAWWGRGYATEASDACLRVAADLRLTQVIAIADPANAASQRVLEKLGLHADGMRMAYGREHVLYRLDHAAA